MAVVAASAADVQAALSAATDRVLGYEDRLAAAATGVLRIAGRSAASKFGDKAVLTAAAGDGGWEPPHPDELVDVDAIVSALRTKSDPIRRSAIANYGKALGDLHPDANWDVTNPLVGGALSGSAQHVTAIADTTRINLMRIIGASYEEGLTIEDTQKAIRQGMDAASQVRGRLIARTELAAVTNGGSLAATQILADATGDTYYKRWMTAPGAHYPRHEDYDGLDGQTVGLGDHFDVGTASLRFPGDPDGPPEEICNCRCTLAYVSSPDEGEADVGITPFREGVDDPVGFYDSDKFRRFELDAARYADNFGVTIDQQEQATGVWEGAEEPSVHFHAHDGDLGVQAFAAALGRAYRQDGVAIFEPGPGPDVIARFRGSEAPGGAPPKVLNPSTLSKADLAKLNASIQDAYDNLDAAGVSRTWRSGLFPKATTPNEIEGIKAVKEPGGEGARAAGNKIEFNVENKDWLDPAAYERDAETIADGGTPIAQQESPADLIIHEQGHAVYQALDVEQRKEWDALWTAKGKEDIGVSRLPSFYAQENKAEAWAETFVTLVRGRPQGAEWTTLQRKLLNEAGLFGKPLDPEKAYAAMADAGLPAGRIADGSLEIFGSGPEFVAQLERLSGDLGVEYDYYPGKFTLLERDAGDYEKAIGDAQSAEAGQARKAGRGAAELPGHAPLEEGAGGAEAGAPLAAPAPRLEPIPDVSAPPAPTAFDRLSGKPPYPPAEAARLGTDRLWGAHAQVGKLENEARRELPELGDDQLSALLWEKGLGKLPKDTLTFDDLAGDQQVHTFYSDGHNSVQQVADEAMKRGETQIVISDHAHAMTTADIEAQHAEIDRLNDKYAGKFKILKGIEANILADGTLDVAPEVLARFDVVNAAIHGHIQGPGGQLALFKEANTARLLKAMDDPELTVLVHPHAIGADWDAVAIKAEQKGVALEINGRDMLRNDTQEAAADMIAAAKRHGALLVIGSDAHVAEDLVDFLYATRFAAQHGVKVEDLAPLARATRAGDPSSSIPASLDSTGPRSYKLGGGMNEVWKIDTEDGREFVVKPEPDPERFLAMGIDTENPLRANIDPGRDLERERAAYVFSRLFNDVGEGEFRVNVPAYRLGELKGDGETVQAGIAEFVDGQTPHQSGFGEDWEVDLDPRTSDQAVRSAGLFDAVIGNTDRHGGNWIVGNDEQLWLIDHGLTFPVGPGNGYDNAKLLDRAVANFGELLDANEVEFLERLSVRLGEVEPELERLLGPLEIEHLQQRIASMVETAERVPPSEWGGTA